MGMDEVKSLLRIPDELDVFAIVPFGYPAKSVGKGKKNRKRLSEVAHLESFNSRFSEPKP
jgi:nitroreductase